MLQHPNYRPPANLDSRGRRPPLQKHSCKPVPSELDRLEREIASTDLEIDELVYELYGITDAELKIIEGA